jgi:hypothetical protein
VFDDQEPVDNVAFLLAGTKRFHHNFPAIIVLVGELGNYYGERDRHLIYIDASLAAMDLYARPSPRGLRNYLKRPPVSHSELNSESPRGEQRHFWGDPTIEFKITFLF